YNPVNGGIERWFEPVADAIAGHPAMRAVLAACHRLFERLTAAAARPPVWHVEVHQFRIEARTGAAGRPTPEGMHRDGVDWVLVLLVNRVNIASGETSIADLAKRPLGSFTLTLPLDAAVTDDNRVYHGVTPVTPVDPARPGHRDVLVVTFRRE
ncbi:MAG TPA: 2OG-Fe dioxygenase family protein, partial [Stellaceae bacterium]|nr:2OG-Fe dioxygenase family protein [Stellaceae bacterium]